MQEKKIKRTWEIEGFRGLNRTLGPLPVRLQAYPPQPLPNNINFVELAFSATVDNLELPELDPKEFYSDLIKTNYLVIRLKQGDEIVETWSYEGFKLSLFYDDYEEIYVQGVAKFCVHIASAAQQISAAHQILLSNPIGVVGFPIPDKKKFFKELANKWK